MILKCKFKVIELLDKRNDGSELEEGNIYNGEMNSDSTKVYYTDKTGAEWVFYPGETCHIVSITEGHSLEARIMFIIDKLKKQKIKVTVENISVASLFSSGGTINSDEEIELAKKIIAGYKPGQAILNL